MAVTEAHSPVNCVIEHPLKGADPCGQMLRKPEAEATFGSRRAWRRSAGTRGQPGISCLPRTHAHQRFLDGTKRFYGQHQALIDGTTRNTGNVATSRKDYVAQLNSNNWQSKQLTQAEQDQTSAGIFGSASGNIFDDTLNDIKASQLFSTISVGVSAEAIFLVGGLGGLGARGTSPSAKVPKGTDTPPWSLKLRSRSM